MTSGSASPNTGLAVLTFTKSQDPDAKSHDL